MKTYKYKYDYIPILFLKSNVQESLMPENPKPDPNQILRALIALTILGLLGAIAIKTL